MRRNLTVPYKTAISSSTWLVVVGAPVAFVSHTETLNQVSRGRVKLALNSPSFKPVKLPAAETRSEKIQEREKDTYEMSQPEQATTKCQGKNLVILGTKDFHEVFRFNMQIVCETVEQKYADVSCDKSFFNDLI